MKEKKTIIKPVSIASVCILAVSTLIFTVQAFEDKPDGKVQETTTAVTTVAEETTAEVTTAEVTTTVTTVTELPKTSITTGVTTVSTAETTSVTELTTELTPEPTPEPVSEPTTEPMPESTPETVTEPVPEPVPEPTPTPEFIVYKETTHYVHRSTCRWYNPDVCREITSTEGLEARLCTECNPDIEIITPYVEPVYEEPVYVPPAEVTDSANAPTIGSYVGTYSATAYTHTGNPCASGTYPYVAKWIDGVCYRTVAADYNFSLGQKLYIEAGDYTGYVIVEDRGGFGYGVIDIFMDSYNECINWGRRNIEVYYVN